MLNIIILTILIIIIFYIRLGVKEKFIVYPYNPIIKTPQSNYLDIVKKIEDQDKYKYDLSVALSPTPTIKCDKLNTKSNCNDNGCNWFGTFCSSMYPSYL